MKSAEFGATPQNSDPISNTPRKARKVRWKRFSRVARLGSGFYPTFRPKPKYIFPVKGCIAELIGNHLASGNKHHLQEKY